VGKNQEIVQVAVKVMKLENITTSMEEIQMEVRAMKMNRHPNVLDLYCCFVVESELWMVMPPMSKGSCYYAMKKLSGHGPSQGFSEDVVVVILYDLLLGLHYVHQNHQIHRDIKAGNLLLAEDGTIKIADFGVAGWFHKEDGLSRNRRRASSSEEGGGVLAGGAEEERRTTFVGTPCWMAPEVMESHKSNKAYNEKVDVWSVGITALELAKGYAPYSRLSPMQVILKTLQEPPPSLRSYEGILASFSDAFNAFVARCLIKNPLDRCVLRKSPACSTCFAHPPHLSFRSHTHVHAHATLYSRPTTQELLSDPFFKRLDAVESPREPLLALLKSIPDVFLKGSGKVARKAETTAVGGALGEGTSHAPGTTWNFLEDDLRALNSINPSVNVPSTLAEGDEEEEEDKKDVTIHDVSYSF